MTVYNTHFYILQEAEQSLKLQTWGNIMVQTWNQYLKQFF